MHHDRPDIKLSLNDKESLTGPEKFENSDEICQQKPLKDIDFHFFICYRHKWVSLLIAVIITIVITASAALFFLLKHPDTNETQTTTVPSVTVPGNVSYDCVNGSIGTVMLDDGKLHKLADLNLPEKQPTLTVGSLEYLFVPNKTQWWYALKYCTGWCGYLVSIKGQEENDRILEMVKKGQTEMSSNYWIGLKGWKNAWYLDDESNATYFNFLDREQANADMMNVDHISSGCIQADQNGIWSLLNCRAMLPFVCERNTASENIQRTPFHPHQEEKCSNAGGTCIYATECEDIYKKKGLCPVQASNIVCCVLNKLKPVQIINSTITQCAEVNGTCNHVDADQCRNGRVLFRLSKSCPDRPRKYDCCIKNNENLKQTE